MKESYFVLHTLSDDLKVFWTIPSEYYGAQGRCKVTIYYSLRNSWGHISIRQKIKLRLPKVWNILTCVTEYQGELAQQSHCNWTSIHFPTLPSAVCHFFLRMWWLPVTLDSPLLVAGRLHQFDILILLGKKIPVGNIICFSFNQPSKNFTNSNWAISSSLNQSL